MQDEVSHPVFLTDSNRGVRISLIQIVVRRVESRRMRWRQEMHGGGEAAAFPKPYFFDVSLSSCCCLHHSLGPFPAPSLLYDTLPDLTSASSSHYLFGYHS